MTQKRKYLYQSNKDITFARPVMIFQVVVGGLNRKVLHVEARCDPFCHVHSHIRLSPVAV